MTKRRDVLKQIRTYAKQHGYEIRVKEGGNHTRVWMNGKYTTIARHSELDDKFAQKIYRQLGMR